MTLPALCLAALLAHDASAQTTQRQYLSGTHRDNAVAWDFFCTSGRRSGAWSTIPVPSCWDMQGFGRLSYSRDEPDHEVERGLYRHRFAVPADWAGRCVRLVFEGVMTDAEVTVNGRPAGPVHQGGFYQFKYDVTPLLHVGGENLLEVNVAKRSANASINRAERTADFWLFGGIFRPVYLEAVPEQHVERVAIDARADGTFAIDVHAGGLSTVDRVGVDLLDAAGRVVGAADAAPAGELTTLRARVREPDLWTAETPTLYTARVRLEANGVVLHELTLRFGFRTVEVRAGDGIYVNGKRVVMKGICRHAFWPDSGRTLTPAIDRDDVALIRSMNMNAVRCTHYPPDQSFLDACDEQGLYVLDELTSWQKPYDADTAKRLAADVVTRDVNHPSIVLWDNGNEGGWNVEADPVFPAVDPQRRAVMHPWALHDGINTKHYPSYALLTKLLSGPDVVMPTEFLHGLYDGGMGAGLRDYWDAIVASRLGAGGFLWVLGDEGVRQPDGRIDVAGNAAPDGIVGPYRQKEASAFTVQKIWSPVVLPDALPRGFAGVLTVRNGYDFISLRRVRFAWELRRWGGVDEATAGYTVVVRGSAASPDVGPGATGTLVLDAFRDGADADALAVTATDPTGREIWTWVYPLHEPAMTQAASAPTPPAAATVVSGDVTLDLDPRSGLIRSATRGATTLPLTNGPRLAMGTPRPHEARRSASTTAAATTTTTTTPASTSRPATQGRLVSAAWTAEADGWFRLDYAIEASGPAEFLGVTFDLPESSVRSMRYLGLGPYPVWQNRLEGGTLGVWELAYNDTITGWSRWEYPEFKGYRAGVRWAKIATNAGTITLRPETPGLYLHVLTPRFPPGKLPLFAAAPFPEGGLSLLHAIPAMGNKFSPPEDLGPGSQPFAANGLYRGTVHVRFQ